MSTLLRLMTLTRTNAANLAVLELANRHFPGPAVAEQLQRGKWAWIDSSTAVADYLRSGNTAALNNAQASSELLANMATYVAATLPGRPKENAFVTDFCNFVKGE